MVTSVGFYLRTKCMLHLLILLIFLFYVQINLTYLKFKFWLLYEESLRIDNIVYNGIWQHLGGLQLTLDQHFPQYQEDNSWIRNPFVTTTKPIIDAANLEKWEYATTHSGIKQKFKETSTNVSWTSLSEENSNLSKRATHISLSFVATYVFMWGRFVTWGRSKMQT